MQNDSRGYTLIELLITLVIASILLVGAVTFGTTLVVRNQSQTVANELLNTLHYARISALSVGFPIVFRHIQNDWVLFIDYNDNTTLDPDDVTLKTMADIPKTSHLSWHGFIAKDYLQFTPQWLNTTLSGSWQFCPSRLADQFGWKIIMNRLGRTRLQLKSECS